MSDDCTTTNRIANTESDRLNRQEPGGQLMTKSLQCHYSIAETAEMTGLSEKHIRRATKQGALACSNVGGTGRPTYRIAETEIAAWMLSTRIPTGSTKQMRQDKVDRHFSKPAKDRISSRNPKA